MPFKKKLSEKEQEALDAKLAEARRVATIEIRDGREFTVLRLPDRYAAAGPTGGRVDGSQRLDSLLGDE